MVVTLPGLNVGLIKMKNYKHLKHPIIYLLYRFNKDCILYLSVILLLNFGDAECSFHTSVLHIKVLVSLILVNSLVELFMVLFLKDDTFYSGVKIEHSLLGQGVFRLVRKLKGKKKKKSEAD